MFLVRNNLANAILPTAISRCYHTKAKTPAELAKKIDAFKYEYNVASFDGAESHREIYFPQKSLLLTQEIGYHNKDDFTIYSLKEVQRGRLYRGIPAPIWRSESDEGVRGDTRSIELLHKGKCPVWKFDELMHAQQKKCEIEDKIKNLKEEIKRLEDVSLMEAKKDLNQVGSEVWKLLPNDKE
jgi:hypothetical protein